MRRVDLKYILCIWLVLLPFVYIMYGTLMTSGTKYDGDDVIVWVWIGYFIVGGLGMCMWNYLEHGHCFIWVPWVRWNDEDQY